MSWEKHSILIIGWSKQEILDKINEIFKTYDFILSLKIDPNILEYEVSIPKSKRNKLKNPSVRGNK